MSNLRRIADRITLATGPDRDIDCEIMDALALWPESWVRAKSDVGRVWGEGAAIYYHHPSEPRWRIADKFTASLDAAITLVPAGWSFSLGQMMGLPPKWRWRCHLRDHNEPYDPYTCAWVDRDCMSAALSICAAALCAAALRASASPLDT